jgi:hypothetical protein
MSKCEHDLAVRQDPNSGDHELLFCTLGCGLEPKRRVSAAASIKEAARQELAEMRMTFASTQALCLAVEEAQVAANRRIAEIDERLKKLEQFGGAP